MADAAEGVEREVEAGRAKQTAKDLFAGAMGGIAQVLLGEFRQYLVSCFGLFCCLFFGFAFLRLIGGEERRAFECLGRSCKFSTIQIAGNCSEEFEDGRKRLLGERALLRRDYQEIFVDTFVSGEGRILD